MTTQNAEIRRLLPPLTGTAPRSRKLGRLLSEASYSDETLSQSRSLFVICLLSGWGVPPRRRSTPEGVAG